MDLEKSVGKLLIGRLPGTTLDADAARALQDGIISGITLFKENAQSIPQLLKLSADIYRHYDGMPLLCVDQEGGAVQRFDHLLTALPSPMSIAASGSLNTAREIIELACRQLKLMGINCLLAPVLDISSNPRNPIVGTRSFGSDPSMVTSLGLTFSTAIARAGMMAVGKHFPGHGETHEDSHLSLAVNHSDAYTLWQRELVPFAGCAVHLPAFMVGHIWLPAAESKILPASLSPKVITGLLREYLQFEGLIMTDDLMMKAVVDRWGLEEAAVQAIAAGAEQLLVLGSIGEIRSVHKAVLKAVAAGRIKEWQIKAAVKSIAASRRELKQWPDFEHQDLLDQVAGQLEASIKAGKEITFEAARQAIGLLRGKCPYIRDGAWAVLVPEHERYSLPVVKYLKSALKKAGMNNVEIKEIRYQLNPKDCQAIIAACRDVNCLFLTFRALTNTGQSRLGKALIDSDKQRVTVACDVPYDLIGLPGWKNCLATFDPSDLAMEALSYVLTTPGKPQGICPVSFAPEII